jgi:hypothetical protein
VILVFGDRSFDQKVRNAMAETPQYEQSISEKTREPMESSHAAWNLPATHRRPSLVVLIILLILLQLVLGGIVVVHAWRLMDLGERIERLEKK